MLVGGEGLCKEDWKRWPKDTPLLIAHGEGDKVTDHKASEEFVRNVGGLGAKAEYKGFPGFYVRTSLSLILPSFQESGADEMNETICIA